MMKKELVRCIQCNAVALFSPLDRSPEYRIDSGTWKVVERDDRQAFMDTHRRHPLERLKVLDDTFISSQNYREPVKTCYFEATNGKERFLLKRFRKSALDPLRYELVPGRLCISPIGLRVDGAAIQKELERAVSGVPLSRQKIGHFVRELEQLVSRTEPGELIRVPYESHHPAVWYYYLDEPLVARALERASRFLARTDVQRMGAFMRQHLTEDPFLAVAQVHFHVENHRQGQKPRVMSP